MLKFYKCLRLHTGTETVKLKLETILIHFFQCQNDGMERFHN